MNRRPFIVFLAVAIAAIAISSFIATIVAGDATDHAPDGTAGVDPNGLELPPNNQVTFQAEVLGNSSFPCVYPEETGELCIMDGPNILTLDAPQGTIRVAYDYGFTSEADACRNLEVLQVAETIRPGQEVEVHAAVLEPGHFSNGDLSTCDSDDYYIRILE